MEAEINKDNSHYTEIRKHNYHNDEIKKDNYHHGNLRNELIIAGLKIVSEEGIEKLSLRKAATMCGVSHAAPKSHFNDKEEFNQAIREYTEELFASYFQQVLDQYGLKLDKDEITIDSLKGKEWYQQNGYIVIRDIGYAYVRFYMDYPECFWFMLKDPSIQIEVSEECFGNCNCKPFQMFRDVTSYLMRMNNYSNKQIVKEIIHCWALVNGLTGFLAMKGFEYEGDFMELTKMCLGE